MTFNDQTSTPNEVNRSLSGLDNIVLSNYSNLPTQEKSLMTFMGIHKTEIKDSLNSGDEEKIRELTLKFSKTLIQGDNFKEIAALISLSPSKGVEVTAIEGEEEVILADEVGRLYLDVLPIAVDTESVWFLHSHPSAHTALTNYDVGFSDKDEVNLEQIGRRLRIFHDVQSFFASLATAGTPAVKCFSATQDANSVMQGSSEIPWEFRFEK